MIKVNLLPQDMARGGGGAAAGGASGGASASNEGGAVALVIMLLVLVILGGGSYYLYSQYNEAKTAHAAAKAESEKVKRELDQLKAEWEEIERDLQVMRNQIAVIETLDPEDRLLWTKKLNLLPMLVPENVFLTEILVTEKVEEKETDDSIKAYAEWNKTKKGPAPLRVKQPIIRQTLSLSGVAYSPNNRSDERLERITEFIRNLQESQAELPFDGKSYGFLEGMRPTINYSDIKQGTAGGREVLSFRFNIEANPIQASTKKKDAPKPAAPATPGRR